MIIAKDLNTRETCWKPNGRPQGNKNGKFSKPSKSFQAETVSGLTSTVNGFVSAEENLPFMKKQLDLLYKIMGELKVTPTSTSYAFAQSGTLHKPLTTTVVPNSNSWIIDSRASDHMTKESNFFLSYIPCFGKQKVQAVD